ncbi:FkbM family methyltransferase [Desertimonas flava]|uniref:FkbM family methyltransferase n=1 Tax=Desertimonas flava TaxID=2064846 RepID=UPI0013C3FF28|nr:FkbM family methyltransferase [Desertimonas flava]
MSKRRLPIASLTSMRRRIAGSWLNEVRRGVRRRRIDRRGGFVVNAAGSRIYVDSNDPRGQALFFSGGVVDVDVVRTWCKLVREIEPTVALDVGANYGEVMMSTVMPENCTMLLVEPNPMLLGCLSRTFGDQIASGAATLVPAGASDSAGRARLYLASHSGLSSVSKPTDLFVEIQLVRLSDIVSFAPEDRVVFKVDVEGHDVHAIRGMPDMPSIFAGICEAESLSDSDLADLSTRFSLFAVTRDLAEIPVRVQPGDTWSTIEARLAVPIFKDVVLRPIGS